MALETTSRNLWATHDGAGQWVTYLLRAIPKKMGLSVYGGVSFSAGIHARSWTSVWS